MQYGSGGRSAVTGAPLITHAPPVAGAKQDVMPISCEVAQAIASIDVRIDYPLSNVSIDVPSPRQIARGAHPEGRQTCVHRVPFKGSAWQLAEACLPLGIYDLLVIVM